MSKSLALGQGRQTIKVNATAEKEFTMNDNYDMMKHKSIISPLHCPEISN